MPGSCRSRRQCPAIDPTPVTLPNTGPVIGRRRAARRLCPRRSRPHRAALRHAGNAVRPPYPRPRSARRGSFATAAAGIDERGRVTAVEPVGTADPAFLSPRAGTYRALALPAGDGGRPAGRLVDGDHASLRARRLAAAGLAARGASAYLRLMSWFPRPVSPRAALADLRRFLAPAQPRADDRRRAGAAGDDHHRHRSSSSIRRSTPRRRRRSSMSSSGAPTAPMPKSSPSRKRTRRSARPRRRTATPIPGAREPVRHLTSDRALHGRGGRAGRGGARPNRAQSQCRLPDRLGSRRRSSAAARPSPAAGRMPKRSRSARPAKRQRRDRLHRRWSPAPTSASAARPAPTCWSRPGPPGLSSRSRIPTRAPTARASRGSAPPALRLSSGRRRGGRSIAWPAG